MKKLSWLLILLIVLLPAWGEAQCAMCKAVVESGEQGGSSVADGLNAGIVYLMAFPYLLMGAVGFAIYRYKKHKSA